VGALTLGTVLVLSGCGVGPQVEEDLRSVTSQGEVNTDFVPVGGEGDTQPVTLIFVLSNRASHGLAVEVTTDSGTGGGEFFGACLARVIGLQMEPSDEWDMRIYDEQADLPPPPGVAPLFELSSRGRQGFGPPPSGVRQIDIAITDQGAEIVGNRIIDPALAPIETDQPLSDCPAS
jgi:hypothetical protein